MKKNIALSFIGLLAILLTSCASDVQASPLSTEGFVSITQPSTELLPQITASVSSNTMNLTYLIVDTEQENCFNNTSAVHCPADGAAFSGQDAQYNGNQPNYSDNGDGTITDNVTGLMWQQDPGEKMTYDQAVAGTSGSTLAGYSDWRLPTIKELYSLIQFDGLDPSGSNVSNLAPFIDTDYFNFEYGDESAGERLIDSQWATSTKYVSTTMNGNETMFGVNFADGRIKGYPTQMGPGGQPKTFFVIYVRGNMAYGENSFVDNADGTISDNATGLTWTQSDNASGITWEAALNYCESLDIAGITDWRLPNVKELQSIVDYSRSPDTTNSAAIDPFFSISTITNEAGQNDYPAFWTSTTHANPHSGGNAAYVNFGRSMGYMNGRWMDVHGAGAQRSDPKTGDPNDWSEGHGPQGDAIRIYNYVRCVRSAEDLSTPARSTTVPPLVTDDKNANTSPSRSDYSLLAPLDSATTYLVDDTGQTSYTWKSAYRPGNAVYLLENGNLLRTGNTKTEKFSAGGEGGIVEAIAPDGTVVWSFDYDSSTYRQHHDIEPLPNGHVLLIAWELKTTAEAIGAGRDPSLLSDNELWPDHIVEVNPAGNIVWEWHIWDHLIQDFDASKENYGVVADHPELIDLNFTSMGPKSGGADWTHINSIDYNAELDQIMLSVHNFSEIWVIDHSTITAEAAGHSGGNSSQGGDLLYRWGNPQAYDAGTASDQVFFGQHDAQWIPTGYPGENNILVFNNGNGRGYSSIDELVTPVDVQGSYTQSPLGTSFAPEDLAWTYVDENLTDFYAENISGAQRLPDGNTLICNGPSGYIFEVSPTGETVWDYQIRDGKTFRVLRYAADYPGLPDTSTQVSEQQPAESPGRTREDHLTGEQTPKIDLASAAVMLGISEAELRTALGPPPPDLAAAAQKLGITEEALIEALGIPVGGQEHKPSGQQP